MASFNILNSKLNLLTQNQAKIKEDIEKDHVEKVSQLSLYYKKQIESKNNAIITVF
jgi:hypothetical protein